MLVLSSMNTVSDVLSTGTVRLNVARINALAGPPTLAPELPPSWNDDPSPVDRTTLAVTVPVAGTVTVPSIPPQLLSKAPPPTLCSSNTPVGVVIGEMTSDSVSVPPVAVAVFVAAVYMNV